MQFDHELHAGIDRMLELMRQGQYVAISGSIEGLALRVIAMNLTGSGQSQIILVNPRLEPVSTERQTDQADIFVVSGFTRTGQGVRLRTVGLLGRILQHHIEVLDERPIFDRTGNQAKLLTNRRLGGRCP